MGPAASQGIAGDLRHGEKMDEFHLEPQQGPSGEIRDHVVVEQGREHRAEEELRVADGGRPQAFDADVEQVGKEIEKSRFLE